MNRALGGRFMGRDESRPLGGIHYGLRRLDGYCCRGAIYRAPGGRFMGRDESRPYNRHQRARFIAPLVGDSWGAMNRAPTIISPLSWFGHHFLDHYPNAADLFECIR